MLTVSPGEVSSLEHEVLDDPVELALDVSLALGRLLGQLDEVLGRLGHRLAEQPDLDAAGLLAADGDVEPHLVSHLGAVGGRVGGGLAGAGAQDEDQGHDGGHH